MALTEGLRNGKKAAVLAALKLGNSRRAACRAVGIDPATLWRWMQADANLCNDVTKAEAESEQYYLGHIQAAAPESWQAAAWWLERRLPADYARKDTVTVLQKLQSEMEKMTDEQLLAFAGGSRSSDPAAVGGGAVSAEGATASGD